MGIKRRIAGAVIAGAAALALPLAGAALAAPSAGAAVTHVQAGAQAGALAAPPPCAAGFSPITNQAGGAIAGTGVNNPVNLQTTGNCFKAENPEATTNGTSYEYVNGDGHCLWLNANTLEVGANDCVAGHINEMITGETHNSSGWTLIAEANQELLQPNVCGSIGTKVTTMLDFGGCARWTV